MKSFMVKCTGKGSITLPKDILKKMDLTKDDVLTLVNHKDTLLLKKVVEPKVREFKEVIKKAKPKKGTRGRRRTA